MGLRSCLGGLDRRPCGRLTRATRCPVHAAQVRQPYNGTYRARRGLAIQGEPWCHSTPCPYPDAGTRANPLTADHINPIANGGADGPLTVLCLRCNSGKRDRLR